MTRQALRGGAITEDSLTMALLTCRGDLFLTSQYLGCTAREIDAYVRASDDLRAFVQAIAQVKSSDEYDKLSTQQFEAELARVGASNRLEAEEIIADMARMDFDSAAMAEVKLKAAVALRGQNSATRTVDSEQSSALAELNRLYSEAAPRIRSVRAVQIEYEP